jgi:ABC-type cobalamin transport system permease subunit
MHSNDVVAKVKRITIKVLIAAVALAIVGSALYTFATLEFSYSEGERVGFVQ